MQEHGFVDLMKYNPVTDQLEVTDELMNGNSEVLKDIAANVKDFAGNWDAVWENIRLRASGKNAVAAAAEKTKNPELLEAGMVMASNEMFHMIIDRVKEESGGIDSKRVLFEFTEWLKRELKRGR